jgi:DNA-binding HxlR family transcriptional regulator
MTSLLSLGDAMPGKARKAGPRLAAEQAGTIRSGTHRMVSDGATDAAGARERRTVAAMVESIVGCKWSLAVLAQVSGGNVRPGGIQRACEGLSTKVLNERLRKMTRFGVLRRTVHPDRPPRVEYTLTELGRRLVAVLHEIERLQDDVLAGCVLLEPPDAGRG